MTPRLLFLLPVAAGLSLGTSFAAAAGSDELWEITSRMDDRASGFAMPPTTQRQCLRKGAKTDDVVPMQKDCRMLDLKSSGSKTTYRFECTGPERMSGSGEVDRPGPDQYSGRMQMRGAAQGRGVDMTLVFSGRRVGDCTVGEPAPGIRPG